MKPVAKLMQPSKNCIELLEEILEMARKGDVVAVAVASLEVDGSRQQYAQDTYSVTRLQLLGSVQLLSVLLIDKLREGANPKGT